jgi:hypothetical protein
LRLCAPIRSPLLLRDQHFAVAAAVDFEAGDGFRWRRGSSTTTS